MMVGGLLSPADAPAADSIINILLRFDDMIPLEDLRELFVKHLVPYERFHAVPLQHNFGPVTWMPQKVDIAQHIIPTRITRPDQQIPSSKPDSDGRPSSSPPPPPSPAVLRELQQLLRDEAEKHLNTLLSTKSRGLPWWEVHHITVDGTTFGGLLVRIHHAIGDGVSLMEAMADVLQDAKGHPLDLSQAFSPSRQGGGKASGGFFSQLNPFRAGWLLFDGVKSVMRILAATAVGCDTHCAFQDTSRLLPMQPNRFTVYFPSHSLALIKTIRAALEAKGLQKITINDIEFALFAGAVAKFCKKHGDDPSTLSLRALTAFAVPEKVCQVTRYRTLLRNNFTLLINTIPLRAASAVDRVKASNRSWQRIKTSTIVPVSFLIHRLNCALPAAAQRNTFKELLNRHSVVFSNVPGPNEPVFMGGREIRSAHMLYPNLAQQVGILSVNGTIHMCIVMASSLDKAQIRQELPGCFLEELDELCVELGVPRQTMLSHIHQM